MDEIMFMITVIKLIMRLVIMYYRTLNYVFKAIKLVLTTSNLILVFKTSLKEASCNEELRHLARSNELLAKLGLKAITRIEGNLK
jgi:hypothetical protein